MNWIASITVLTGSCIFRCVKSVCSIEADELHTAIHVVLIMWYDTKIMVRCYKITLPLDGGIHRNHTALWRWWENNSCHFVPNLYTILINSLIVYVKCFICKDQATLIVGSLYIWSCLFVNSGPHWQFEVYVFPLLGISFFWSPVFVKSVCLLY
jgi:hypothetical protein